MDRCALLILFRTLLGQKHQSELNHVCAFVFQPVESATEDKKKSKVEKVKKCIRTAAGTSWEDPSLLEWESGTN